MKKIVYGFLVISSIFVISGCSDKKEPASEIPIETSKLIEKASEPTPIPAAPMPSQVQHGADIVSPHGSAAPSATPEAKKHQYTILVPEDVQKSWSGVKLQVMDKKDKKVSDVEIALGSQYKIPETNINITASQFLPDFRIDSIAITSSSNKPINPAVKVTITDGSAELFNGWLFSRFPNAHPFNHDRYALSLVSGVLKKK